MFSKIIAVIFLWLSIFFLTIFILMYGWGLTPISWSWIIGGNILQIILVGCMQGVAKEISKG